MVKRDVAADDEYYYAIKAGIHYRPSRVVPRARSERVRFNSTRDKVEISKFSIGKAHARASVFNSLSGERMNKMSLNLFEELELSQTKREELCSGAVVLRGFALPVTAALHDALSFVAAAAPFRYMITPSGFRMSVAMTNCGSYGWISDRNGYRYSAIDPVSHQAWPGMPDVFLKLAQDAATIAGFEHFMPDACLINRYDPGTRLSLHQDKNERDFKAPIVSVSLGIPAVFLWGGLCREERQVRVPLFHADVMVWGGPARLRYHGVLPIKEEYHQLTGWCRINLTFRKVL